MPRPHTHTVQAHFALWKKCVIQDLSNLMVTQLSHSVWKKKQKKTPSLGFHDKAFVTSYAGPVIAKIFEYALQLSLALIESRSECISGIGAHAYWGSRLLATLRKLACFSTTPVTQQNLHRQDGWPTFRFKRNQWWGQRMFFTLKEHNVTQRSPSHGFVCVMPSFSISPLLWSRVEKVHIDILCVV